MSVAQHRGRAFFAGIALGLLVVALFALALRDDSFIGFWDEWWRMHDIDELAQSIRASGQWGVAVSIGLMVVHSFIPFPAEVVALANGIIYGTIFGTLITWTGAMLGAQAAFWTARSFGEPIVNKYVRADRRAGVDRWIAKNGTAALLTMRLIPVIAFNLINYAAGLAKVRWWTVARISAGMLGRLRTNSRVRPESPSASPKRPRWNFGDVDDVVFTPADDCSDFGLTVFA